LGVRKWIGYVTHAMLGLLAPYVLGGCIMLIYGLMTPSTGLDKLLGISIAVVYAAILAGVNWVVLRGESGKAIGIGLLVNVLIWAASSALMFYLFRTGL
jgi:hypothetical protein